jgi:hypothetical protein
MTNLNGKTALVTGASRGIGRASALALAKDGAQVLIHYSSGEKEADAVVSEIRAAGGKAQKVGGDLRQADGPHALARQVREIVGDRLDILVANAGISKAASIEDTTVEDFELHQHRCRPRGDARHAGTQAHRATRRHCRSGGLPRLRQRTLGDGRYAARRRRLETLNARHSNADPKKPGYRHSDNFSQ